MAWESRDRVRAEMAWALVERKILEMHDSGMSEQEIVDYFQPDSPTFGITGAVKEVMYLAETRGKKSS